MLLLDPVHNATDDWATVAKYDSGHEQAMPKEETFHDQLSSYLASYHDTSYWNGQVISREKLSSYLIRSAR